MALLEAFGIAPKGSTTSSSQANAAQEAADAGVS